MKIAGYRIIQLVTKLQIITLEPLLTVCPLRIKLDLLFRHAHVISTVAFGGNNSVDEMFNIHSRSCEPLPRRDCVIE